MISRQNSSDSSNSSSCESVGGGWESGPSSDDSVGNGHWTGASHGGGATSLVENSRGM